MKEQEPSCAHSWPLEVSVAALYWLSLSIAKSTCSAYFHLTCKLTHDDYLKYRVWKIALCTVWFVKATFTVNECCFHTEKDFTQHLTYSRGTPTTTSTVPLHISLNSTHFKQ